RGEPQPRDRLRRGTGRLGREGRALLQGAPPADPEPRAQLAPRRLRVTGDPCADAYDRPPNCVSRQGTNDGSGTIPFFARALASGRRAVASRSPSRRGLKRTPPPAGRGEAW